MIIMQVRKAFLLSFLFVIALISNAQQVDEYVNNTDSIVNGKRNIVSVEAGGNGLIYSLNYSRILGKNENSPKGNIIARIGFEIIFDRSSHYELACPFELYFISGTKRLHFEMGLGLTVFSVYDKDSAPYYYTAIFGRIGLSYHRQGDKFYYRIGFTPFFSREISDRVIQPFGGISIGYFF